PEEDAGDPVVQQEPDHGGGKERHEDLPDERPRTRVAAEAGGDGEQLGAVEPDDGQHGAELDEDLEARRLVLGEGQPAAGQDEMAGRGDGHVLGDALDHAEHDRDPHDAHTASSSADMPPLTTARDALRAGYAMPGAA